MKSRILTLLLTCLVPTVAMAADESQQILEFSWQALAKADQLLAGEIVQDDEVGSVLKIEKQGDQSAITLLEIKNPPIESRVYAITGKVRYDGVDEQGYLETWNHFPDGSAYFSRTLGVAGPMQSLSGDSGWREFTVPFSFESDSEMPPPNRVQFNLVLPRGEQFG